MGVPVVRRLISGTQGLGFESGADHRCCVAIMWTGLAYG